VFLHKHAFEAESGRDSSYLPGVVRLNTANRDKRVAILGERLGGEVLELAHLVASVRQSRVAVLPLRPDLDLATEVRAQPLEPVHRRRAEQEVRAVKVIQAHRSIPVRTIAIDSSIWAAHTRRLI